MTVGLFLLPQLTEQQRSVCTGYKKPDSGGLVQIQFNGVSLQSPEDKESSLLGSDSILTIPYLSSCTYTKFVKWCE